MWLPAYESIVESASRSVALSSTTLSTGHLNVGGFFKVTAGQSAPVVTNYAKVVETAKKALPDMEYAVQRGRGWAKVPGNSKAVYNISVGDGEVAHMNLQLRTQNCYE